MNLFPIVSRELLVASRRLGTYASRFAIALLIFAVVGYWMILVGVENYPAHRAGNDMFYSVSCILIFLCNIAGVYLTADCLSEEKRNGTLGLLFLTNLRGYQVVLGKMSVGAIQGVLGLMAAGHGEHESVRTGIDYLLSTQRNDGLWSDREFTAPGFPRVFYLKYHGYSRYFPLWAIGRYSRQHAPS